MNALNRSFLWIRNCPLCYRFTLFTRVLLAAAFIPTGMVKVLGERFTLIGTEKPIGAFFEAMYQTGLFWQFIGLAQVLAGVCLLVPRLAHLGAALFLPIIASIFVITVGLEFRGTPFITGPMLLAVLFLCAWDYHRFRPMFTLQPWESRVPQPRLDRWERVGFALFAVSLIALFGMTRSIASPSFALICVTTGAAAGVFTLGRFLWVWWHQLRLAAPSA